MTYEEMEIVEAMERWGGGFVQALAVCFRKADEDNFAKLLGTFGNYWYQYKAMLARSKRGGVEVLAHGIAEIGGAE